MKLSRLFNSLPKKLAAGAIVALAFALPATSLAASTVKIEADTTVANATTGGNWGSSTSAKYNEVVDIQVVYDNDEAAGSGKTANNLRVKINIPTTAGTSQTITTTTAADNSNTVNGSAKVTLDSANSYLQYIPGTATWKHAVSANSNQTTTQKVSDSVVTGANGLTLENENPCQAGSIQVQVRVVTAGVSIEKQVRIKGTGTWARSITAKPGDTVQYMISYQNTGNTTENNVVIGDKMPDGVTYVPGSTYLANDSAPDGKSVGDGVTTTGIIVGTYGPSANAFVLFDAKLPTTDQLACGDTVLSNLASAQPAGMQYYWNRADVTIHKDCQQTPPPSTPTYACDTNAFHVAVEANRTVKIDGFKFTASDNSTLGSVDVNWGDKSTPLTTNNVVGQMHQYSADGTYTVSLGNFKVNGKSVNVSGNCMQTVTFTTPGTPTPPSTHPAQLPNTGAGDVIGLVVGAIVAGTVASRLYLGRKLSRQ